MSLSNQTYKDYEIIIVDDGSTDGTSEMIAMEFPDVCVIRADGNLWWAEATNRGIQYLFTNHKYSDTDYILTLNNDLEVPENYLQVLVASASRYDKSIIGSVSVDITNTDVMNFCGISWNQFTGKYYLRAKDYDCSYAMLINKKEVIDSDMLSGRGTLIPVSVFKKIGLYDSQRFPQYAADEDFSLRAKRNGWQLLIPVRAYVKSHIDQTGADVVNVPFSVRYLKHLFFSIKSPVNLKTRYRWAMKNTRLKLLYFLLESTKIFLSVSFKMIKRSL